MADKDLASNFCDADLSLRTLTIARSHVLGSLHRRCERISHIFVFLEGDDSTPIGYADESLGVYADAFVFHLSEPVCKKLAAGQYTYSFEYSKPEPSKAGVPAIRNPVKLDRMILVPRKGYEKAARAK